METRISLMEMSALVVQTYEDPKRIESVFEEAFFCGRFTKTKVERMLVTILTLAHPWEPFADHV